MTVGLTRRPRVLRRSGIPADRQRRARRVAYLGCVAALGYGVLKLVWSLGGTVRLRAEQLRPASQGLTALQRLFDYWERSSWPASPW